MRAWMRYLAVRVERVGFITEALNTQNLEDIGIYPCAGPQLDPKVTCRLWI